MKNPTWTLVKAKLATFDRAGLLGLVRDLYAADKENRTFLHARFGLGEDVLEPYKQTIERWLWPDVIRNQNTSVAKAKQAGVSPEVQVALYEYGKSSLNASRGWIRQIQPLTTDLDKISEELFALRTNGGDEYCGWVIKEAANGLNWSSSADVYKAIFIAGNEPFTQGPVDYTESCKAAITKGIIVNTIHCGDENTGINTKWKDGALLADGNYLVIDQNRAVVSIEAPQDK